MPWPFQPRNSQEPQVHTENATKMSSGLLPILENHTFPSEISLSDWQKRLSGLDQYTQTQNQEISAELLRNGKNIEISEEVLEGNTEQVGLLRHPQKPRVGSLHTHPPHDILAFSLQENNQEISGDFPKFLHDPQQKIMILLHQSKVLMCIKTEATRPLNNEILLLALEDARAQTDSPKSLAWKINKLVALYSGCILYEGDTQKLSKVSLLEE